MINTNTVFILGAGASKPYGFPTGEELKNEVLRMNYKKALEYAQLKEEHPNYSAVWNHIVNKYGDKKVASFFEDLRMSGFYSVDAFLENREEYIELGKTLISMQLIKFEDENKLYANDSGDWYQYLYHNMLRASLEEFSENNISFLTFNYDRSLEQFFINSLISDYGVVESEAAELLKSLPIIHLHGKLGNIPILSQENSRLYDNRITIENLEICRSQIKIIHEGIKDDQEFQEAHELLSKAEQVWFLGFGYDKTNIERLSLPNILEKAQIVFGTTYNLRFGEVLRDVCNPMRSKIEENLILHKSELNALSYIREYSNYIK